MSHLTYIDLDIATDDPTRNRMNLVCLQGMTAEEVRAAGCTSVVLQEVGPAGVPLVRLRGPRVALKRYIEGYCGGDAQEREYFESLICRADI